MHQLREFGDYAISMAHDAFGLCALRLTPDHKDASSPPDIEMRQIEAQIELQLVVVGRHVRAQLVKRFVVLGFLHVRQFMHHDHLQTS